MKNEVIIGDCAEVLKQFDDESIDCIVTDPPYGISFMGKEWDKALPSLEALKECNRVLKAGAFGFFMCAPRMDVLWRMGQRLEEAGFRVDFSFIGWAFASGFPKSMDISKAIDKRAGAEREKFLKPIAYPDSNCWGTPNNKSDGACNSGVLGVNKHCEKINAGNGMRWDSKPATDKAREFSGAFASFQPKPALECIITVMKHLSEKTYVDQALKNGHGVTWLGNCRIPCESPHHNEAGRPSGEGWTKQGGSVYYADPEGRFPANLLVSDNCLDQGIITNNWRPSDIIKAKQPLTEGTFLSETASSKIKNNYSYKRPKDSGDFSRYFSLDAWFDKKLSELPEEQQKTFPFLITPKPSKSEKNKYIDNKHPTVKPLKLMYYLITLGSREGDVILDPFAGSGTTLEACKLLNRVFIGIDKDPENEKYMVARGQLNTCTLNNFEEVV